MAKLRIRAEPNNPKTETWIWPQAETQPRTAQELKNGQKPRSTNWNQNELKYTSKLRLEQIQMHKAICLIQFFNNKQKLN